MQLASILVVLTLLGPTSAPKVKITELKKGKGFAAHTGDKVTVDYVGTFTNGKVFDASKKGMPFVFTLGAHEVIQGWDQGVVGMKVGGKRKLFVPSALAYGKRGAGPIPPDTNLVFVVTMNKIEH